MFQLWNSAWFVSHFNAFRKAWRLSIKNMHVVIKAFLGREIILLKVQVKRNSPSVEKSKTEVESNKSLPGFRGMRWWKQRPSRCWRRRSSAEGCSSSRQLRTKLKEPASTPGTHYECLLTFSVLEHLLFSHDPLLAKQHKLWRGPNKTNQGVVK